MQRRGQGGQKTGILKIPMATMALIAPGPASAVIMMAEIMAGKAKMKSPVRMMASSSQPSLCGSPTAQRHAEASPDAHGNQRHGDGVACSQHDHGKEVMAIMIRSKPIGGADGLETLGDIDQERIVRCPDKRDKAQGPQKTG